MESQEFMENLVKITPNEIIKIVQLVFILLFIHYSYIKIINIKNIKKANIALIAISIPIILVIIKIVELKLDIYFKWLVLILLIALVNLFNFKKDLVYSIVLTIISFAISYSIYAFSVLIAFIPSLLFRIENDCISGIIIILIYCFIMFNIFKIKKLKYGISSLQNKMEGSYFNILILNIGAITVFSLVTIQSYSGLGPKKLLGTFLILLIIMFITVQESFKTYYKQKLLEKDLEQTKTELDETKNELEKANRDNLEISQKMHSLDHRQKALKYQLEESKKKGVIGAEELEKQLEDISKDMYIEPDGVELTKTDIFAVDTMLEYMKSECIKNNIDFELQVIDNIHYMVNNFIEESKLEILIADHIKDAIIAIKHSDNSNRSILVRLGKIDECYGLQIYDTGIEFEKEILDKLGKEPVTTHKDEGGTGMGFMNTFKTLGDARASLMIREIGKPVMDNYTKVITIRFDGKNEFRIESYKEELATK